MSSLKVSGAELHYEVAGNGPLLVLVPGAKGEGAVFRGIVLPLSDHYRVVTYDRRGFSRSRLEKPLNEDPVDPNGHGRLIADASDVRQIIEHLSDEPAIVFGNSSGAIVALQVLIDHAAYAETVVAHEPPVVKLLPDSESWENFFLDVYNTYKESGVPAALRLFRNGAFGNVDSSIMQSGMIVRDDPHAMANTLYWIEHELRQYPRLNLDFDAMAAHADKLILVGGRESQDTVAYASTVALSNRMGIDMVELPGGHLGFMQNPIGFSKGLLEVLRN